MKNNQYIPSVTAQDVLRIVSRDFPEHERAGVLSTLRVYGNESGITNANARVHAAILKLGAGNVDLVREYVKAACSDYREVVGPAETPRFIQLCRSSRRMSDWDLEQLKREDWAEYFDWLNRTC